MTERDSLGNTKSENECLNSLKELFPDDFDKAYSIWCILCNFVDGKIKEAKEEEKSNDRR